jgi:hypothetical protein
METIKKNETRDDLINPEHVAAYYAKAIIAEGAVAITEGSPAQIELANRLRSDFVGNLNDAAVGEVLLWIGRNEVKAYRWEKVYSVLARDAVDRNTLRIINVASAKVIIDRLISNEGKIKQHDMHARYCKMMRGDK